MIVPVSVKFDNESSPQMRLAIVLRYLSSTSDLKDLLNALLDVMSTCFSSEEAKDATKAFSFWIINELISELSKDCQQSEKGGEV